MYGHKTRSGVWLREIETALKIEYFRWLQIEKWKECFYVLIPTTFIQSEPIPWKRKTIIWSFSRQTVFISLLWTQPRIVELVGTRHLVTYWI